MRLEPDPHRPGGQPLLEPEGSGEGSPSDREVEARERGMQVRPTSGCGLRGIRDDGRTALVINPRDHPQELVAGSPLPASDARAHRL
jgi:hypothetical protein